MNEANLDVVDGPPAEPHDQAATQRKYDEVEERMTTRLPPVPRPPHMPGRSSQAPGPAIAMLPSVEIAHHTPEVHPPPHTSTSWWRGLLTSTLPPSASVGSSAPNPRLLELRIAVACGSLALALLISALVIGLWAGSSQLPPMVAAAAVIGRALVSLGLLAFGLTFLGAAERLFVRAREDRDSKRF